MLAANNYAQTSANIKSAALTNKNFMTQVRQNRKCSNEKANSDSDTFVQESLAGSLSSKTASFAFFNENESQANRRLDTTDKKDPPS